MNTPWEVGHSIGSFITLGLFFVGLLFAWLKADLKRIEHKLDEHLLDHSNN
jgi:hypothetical protein